MFQLNDKIAIVTGGAGLYGKSISQALAQAGAHVIIASRDSAKCDTYARELQKNKWSAQGMFLDMADEKSIAEFSSQILEQHGHVDIPRD